jgi:hypothetical protein
MGYLSMTSRQAEGLKAKGQRPKAAFPKYQILNTKYLLPQQLFP